MPLEVQRAAHPDRNGSSMSPDAKTIKMLLYVGDEETNDVYVYDYKSGKSVGTLTGFDEPYGECVDATGDIYVANYGDGTVVEYAHGGATPMNTYTPGGTPIGCAVDAKGDVAATSFDPGEVTVYAVGNPNDGTNYSDGTCTYLAAMGYDLKRDLVGVGGTTLTYVSQTTLSDDCYNDYVDVVNPFIVGKKNTPVNEKQGNTAIGANLWCVDGGMDGMDYWHYPKGGLPYTRLKGASSDPYGAAVSIAQ